MQQLGFDGGGGGVGFLFSFFVVLGVDGGIGCRGNGVGDGQQNLLTLGRSWTPFA